MLTISPTQFAYTTFFSRCHTLVDKSALPPDTLTDYVESIKLHYAAERVDGIVSGWGPSQAKFRSELREELKPFIAAARGAKTPLEARHHLKMLHQFDPNKQLSELQNTRRHLWGKLLSDGAVVEGKETVPYVDVFGGNKAKFAIPGQDKSPMIVGEMKGRADKVDGNGYYVEPNQDCMAIVRTIHGGLVFIAADGLGGQIGGHVISEVITTVLAEKMSMGVSFNDALEFAVSVWKEKQKDYVIQYINETFTMGMLGIITDPSSFRSLLEGMLADPDLVDRLMDEVEVETRVNAHDLSMPRLLKNMRMALEEFSDPFFNNKVNPGTTISVTEVIKNKERIQTNMYSIGDSSNRLFLWNAGTDTYINQAHTEHDSYVQKLYADGVFHKFAKNNATSPDDVERLARYYRATYPGSHFVLDFVNDRTKDFTVDPIVAQLLPNVEYLLLLNTDRLDPVFEEDIIELASAYTGLDSFLAALGLWIDQTIEAAAEFRAEFDHEIKTINWYEEKLAEAYQSDDVDSDKVQQHIKQITQEKVALQAKLKQHVVKRDDNQESLEEAFIPKRNIHDDDGAILAVKLMG
jgi:hypothetical protein